MQLDGTENHRGQQHMRSAASRMLLCIVTKEFTPVNYITITLYYPNHHPLYLGFLGGEPEDSIFLNGTLAYPSIYLVSIN